MEVDESYLPMAIKLTYNNINHQKKRSGCDLPDGVFDA